MVFWDCEGYSISGLIYGPASGNVTLCSTITNGISWQEPYVYVVLVTRTVSVHTRFIGLSVTLVRIASPSNVDASHA